MQGYDSVAVKADVELGGIDQKFNLLAGRTIQQKYGMVSQDILMTDILEGTDGRKMSSSWGNVVSLTDDPHDMFAKVMAIPDELIEKYFILATDVLVSEIKSIMSRGSRDAKRALASEIVKLYHGEKKALEAEKEFGRVFSDKQKPTDIPTIKLSEKHISLLDLVVAVEFASSKSEARRLIEQGAVKIDDQKKTDPKEIISLEKEIILQVGPHRFVRVAQDRNK